MIGLGIAQGVFKGLGKLFDRIKEKRQNKQQVKFWNMQNEYNHPTQQMQRLKEAGLNPHLIYGGSPSSAAGNAESVGTAARPYDSDIARPMEFMQQHQNMKLQSAQTDNVKENTNVQIQEAILKAITGAKITAETAKTRQETRQSSQLFRTSLEAQKLNLRSISEDIRNKKLQGDIAEIDKHVKNKTKAYAIAKARYEMQHAKETMTQAQYLTHVKKLEKELFTKYGVTSSDWAPFKIVGRGLLELENYFRQR